MKCKSGEIWGGVLEPAEGQAAYPRRGLGPDSLHGVSWHVALCSCNILKWRQSILGVWKERQFQSPEQWIQSHWGK